MQAVNELARYTFALMSPPELSRKEFLDLRWTNQQGLVIRASAPGAGRAPAARVAPDPEADPPPHSPAAANWELKQRKKAQMELQAAKKARRHAA